MKFSKLQHDRLAGTVYKTIRTAILSGEFQPGDRLKIRLLAEQMGTSVTPVRDALLQLVNERALVMRGPRDIRIQSLTREQYLEIRTLRLMLEGFGAELAAQNAIETEIDELQKNIDETARLYKKNDKPGVLKRNREFHEKLYKLSGMNTLAHLLDGFWIQISPLIAMYFDRSKLSDFVVHHQAVVDALKIGDKKAARNAIRADITEAGKGIIDIFDEQGNIQKTDGPT